MPGSKKAKGGVEKPTNPLFEKKPKSFGIGQSLPPKKDVHRFVKWPVYVRLQRQRRILSKRLKIPPPIEQFNQACDSSTAKEVLRLLMKYRPEDKAAKKERLLKEAEAAVDGKEVAKSKPVEVKYGLNHITYLIEQNKAQLVVIAHDVTPIELVLWLPALCRKMGVPYCIVKSKSRLGAVVHKKTATALALTAVNNEDKATLSKLVDSLNAKFADNEKLSRKWGGGIMGSKSQHKTAAREKLLQIEQSKKLGLRA
jgi:large subunit ribosomal protein L7Ae